MTSLFIRLLKKRGIKHIKNPESFTQLSGF